jgi:hypothetical protein
MMLALAESALIAPSSDEEVHGDSLPSSMPDTHYHEIRKCITNVRTRFEHFSQRLSEVENKLNDALGTRNAGDAVSSVSSSL